MANYSIISDISGHFVKMLREKICPEPLLNSQSIELVSPADDNADYTLGVFLYDIRENTEHLRVNMIPTSDNGLRRPPQSLSAYYMVYINSAAQVGIKQIDSQKILARVSQVLYDNNEVQVAQIQPNLDNVEENIRIASSRLTYDEKSKIWTSVNKPYQMALYYTIAPIFISSEIVKKDPRVASIGYNYTDKRVGD